MGKNVIEMILKKFILIVGFIAATILLIVPIANAENIPNLSSAIAASAVPLPQLRFNETKEKMVVTGELSPGKYIRATDGSLTTTIVPIGGMMEPVGNRAKKSEVLFICELFTIIQYDPWSAR